MLILIILVRIILSYHSPFFRLNMNQSQNFRRLREISPAQGTKSGHIYDRMIPPEEIRQKLDQIEGHLVWMPLGFLKGAEMAEKGLQVNAWTESVYT